MLYSIYSGVTSAYPIEDRIAAIRSVGFDAVCLDFEAELAATETSWDNQVRLCETYGLPIENVHLTGAGMTSVWSEDAAGDRVIDRLIAELRDMAGSLAMFAETAVSPEVLAGAMVESLWQMSLGLLSEKAAVMDRYRSLCVTLNQPVCIHKAEDRLYGFAADIDADGALIVVFPDGTRQTVSSGEVSVRGLYGYI
jgi:hypothetical protein